MYNTFFYLYLTFSAIAAVVSISMWLDYYRKIDVFESEKIKHLILALFIGCFTPFLSIGIYRLIDLTGFTMTGDFYNDLFYTIFAIGVNEELCKIAGVAVAFMLLKRYINEPIDYLIYAGVVALGFSVVENFKYFNNYGIQIITTRAFYSALVHMINTTIIVYGFYRYQLFGKGRQLVNVAVAFIVSSASHGLFDLFLMNDFLGWATPFLSVIVYLIGINFWVQMLNNANNFSHNFSYARIHFSGTIFYRLLFWYLSTLIFTLIYNMIVFTPTRSLSYFFSSVRTDGFLFLIVIIRASRFKIFRQKYFPVKIQLPFYITRNDDEDFRFFYLLPIKIRGENSFEYKLTTYLDKNIKLFPVTSNRTFIRSPREAMITDKLLLHDDIVVYLVKLNDSDKLFFLKPKTRGITEIQEKYTIASLMSCEKSIDAGNYRELRYDQLKPLEWIYIKPEEISAAA
jgi:RsiW-degrading membrane proteinase PrsW (M82 family)